MNSYIDLHVHLDGAVTVAIAKKLAEMQHRTLSGQSDAELSSLLTAPKDCKSLNEFLACFSLPQSLLQTEEALHECAFLVAEQMREQGVVYAEIRFAPQLHTTHGLTQEVAVCAVRDGLARSSLKANLILCCMRGDNTDAENKETVRLAEKYLVADGGVVALDLAGAEALYPTERYRPLFEDVAARNIPFTMHAGEAAGAESVRTAVLCGARRIGHGVRMREDASVVALVRERGVTLEMCPTSNVQTRAIPEIASFPIREYMEQGIRVTLNTDDMGIENTTLADEFRLMKSVFGLTAAEERTLTENAIRAAFTTESVKADLRRQCGL